MKAIWILLLVAVVAGAALLLGKTAAAPDSRTANLREEDVRSSGAGDDRQAPSDRIELAPDADIVTDNRPYATITGRLVRMEDGSGFAGCEVELDLDGDHDIAVQTDDRGCFSLGIPEQLSSYWVIFSGEGRVTRYCSLEELREDQTQDLGTIPLQRGFEVPGQVVDQQGLPVANVAMLVSGYDDRVPAGMTLFGTSTAYSDEQGVFRLVGAIPPGEWQIEIRGEHILLEDTFTITDQGVAPLRLVVRARAKITGSITGPDRQRMTHVDVRTADGNTAATTNDVGDFVLQTDEPRQGPVDLVIDSPHWPDAPRTATAWGARDVQIRLPPTPAIPITVRTESGDPVTRFAHWLGRDGKAAHAKAPEDHPGGHLELEARGRGTFQLRIIPDAPNLLASEPIDVLVTSEPRGPVEVRLRELDPARLRVVNAAGEAVANIEADLFRTFPGVDPTWGIQDLRKPRYGWIGRGNEAIATGMTDTDGFVDLFTPRETDGLMLRLRHDEAQPMFVPATTLARARHQQITWIGSGTIRGTVEVAAGTATSEYAVFVKLPDGRPAHGPRSLELNIDGSFESEPLQAGRYRVQLMEAMLTASPGSSTKSYVPASSTAHTVVEVREGQASEVRLTAPPRQYGRIDGQLLAPDGAALPKRIWLAYIDHVAGGRGEFAIDAAGRFQANQLKPGRYRIALGGLDRRFVGKRTYWSGMLADTITVVAGPTTTLAVECPKTETILELQDNLGRPIDGGVYARFGGRTRFTHCEGELVFEHAMELPVQFARSGDGPWTAPMQIQGIRMTIRLP